MEEITSGERKELEKKEERKKKKYRMKKSGEDGVDMTGKSNSEVEVDLKHCDAGVTLGEAQVALKKHKKKNKDVEGEKHLMIHDGNHDIKRKYIETDMDEAELEEGLKKDAKKKRKKTGDGDDKCSHVQKGEENRKKKWRDVGVDFNVDAEGARNGDRSKVTTLSTHVVDEATSGENTTNWNVIDAGSENYASSGSDKDRVKNMKKSRKTKNKNYPTLGQIVLEVPVEELGAQRNLIAKYDGLTDHKEVEISGNEKKRKRKRKKTSDGCESKNDSSEGKQLWSRENVNAEGNDITETPSNATAKGKKRRERKGKDEKGDIQKPNDHSKNVSHVDNEMTRKFSQAAEADGNRESFGMRKEKGIDEASNTKKKKKRTENASDISAVKKKEKKVRFSNEIEVFPAGNETDNEGNIEVPLVQGKRYTLEEDEKIKNAVMKFIETHQLGEEGLHMVLNCKKYPSIRKCWKEIGTCLPCRPHMSIYCRAHVIFERSEERKWAPEEYEILRRFYATHGSDWKTLAPQLGKHRIHLKDCWRRIKSNFKKGAWSQDEYQKLFDLVNLDLKLKAFEEKKTKHGMLRDNISWGAISEKLSTRFTGACCDKWCKHVIVFSSANPAVYRIAEICTCLDRYKQLASPLVRQGLWNDPDDYRLVEALTKADACCFEDVDWDNLLEHRPGVICRKRWTEMTRHIGGYREKPFIEQVEVLAKRYSSDMIEYRT